MGNMNNSLYNLIPIKNDDIENSEDVYMNIIELASVFNLDVNSNNNGIMLSFTDKHDKKALEGMMEVLKNLKVEEKIGFSNSNPYSGFNKSQVSLTKSVSTNSN